MSDEEKKAEDVKAKCPKCESELHHVEKVGQHYCFSCESYYSHEEVEKAREKEKAAKAAQAAAEAAAAAKEEKAKPKGIPCPECGNTTAPVKDSDNYYCYSCEEFYTKGGKVAIKEESEQKAAEEVKPAAEIKLVEVTHTAEEKPVTETKPVVETKPVTEEKPVVAEKEKTDTIVLSTEMDDMKSELSVEENLILDLLEGNKVKEERRNCPSCGLALTYVQKYDRWYCYTCRKYAPKDVAAEETGREVPKCSKCGSAARYIEKYDRHYCDSCKEYLPATKPAKAKAEAEPAKEKEEGEGAPLCAQCGKPTTWVATYERYYCYPCKKYAPKTEEKGGLRAQAEKAKPLTPGKATGPACATCGKPTSWIAKYNRHYCYYCQKYVPKAEAKTEEKEEKVAEEKATPPDCPTCGKPTNWIAKYERYYCYPCKKYVPK